MIRVYIISIVVGVVAMMSVYQAMKTKIANEAVAAERASVQKAGEVIHEKVSKKKEAIKVAKPPEVDAALRKYCRDC